MKHIEENKLNVEHRMSNMQDKYLERMEHKRLKEVEKEEETRRLKEVADRFAP